MRNHHDRGPTLLEFSNAAEQSRVAIGIQIRTWFIQHHEARIIVNRPGQSNPLTVPARKDGPALADLGFVSTRKPQDHIMDTGHLCRFYDLLIIVVPKTADI